MNVDVLLSHASQQFAREDYAGAIETLRTVLGTDPDHARAHALLSVSLLRQRRRYAAEHEARIALSLDPELPNAHIAAGWVFLAQHDLARAEQAFREALRLSPDEVIALLGLASVALARGDRDAARAELEKVLSIDAENINALVSMAEIDIARGETDAAGARIEEALRIDPASPTALAARGELLLHRGDVAAAREHAIWALRQSATSRRALVLLSNVKARHSFFLGVWWRYNAWLAAMEASRRILALVVMFAVYRALVTLLGQLGAVEASSAIEVIWLVFIGYTWIAMPVFKRMLNQELAGVRLRRF